MCRRLALRSLVVGTATIELGHLAGSRWCSCPSLAAVSSHVVPPATPVASAGLSLPRATAFAAHCRKVFERDMRSLSFLPVSSLDVQVVAPAHACLARISYRSKATFAVSPKGCRDKYLGKQRLQVTHPEMLVSTGQVGSAAHE